MKAKRIVGSDSATWHIVPVYVDGPRRIAAKATDPKRQYRRAADELNYPELPKVRKSQGMRLGMRAERMHSIAATGKPFMGSPVHNNIRMQYDCSTGQLVPKRDKGYKSKKLT